MQALLVCALLVVTSASEATCVLDGSASCLVHNVSLTALDKLGDEMVATVAEVERIIEADGLDKKATFDMLARFWTAKANEPPPPESEMPPIISAIIANLTGNGTADEGEAAADEGEQEEPPVEELPVFEDDGPLVLSDGGWDMLLYGSMLVTGTFCCGVFCILRGTATMPQALMPLLQVRNS